MLHLRVTCPAEATDAVLDCLRRDCGTVHLVLLRGAAVDPPGDLVQADVAREAADGVRTRRDNRDLRHPLTQG
ncbi:MAG: hypothetical protein M3143_03755 [Actinomycetota bacterium]|nr:hypothetical protein [Actinomycetota bacterium]